MSKHSQKFNFKLSRFIVLLAVLLFTGQYVLAGNSGNTEGHAWAEKLGYISMGGGGASVDYGVTVGDAALDGYAWSEKTGWIDFNDPGAYYGVLNDGSGNLSGYAWSEKLGYICFDDPTANNYYQVTMSDIYDFTGYAFSEKGGYINFSGVGYGFSVIPPPYRFQGQAKFQGQAEFR